MQKITSLVVFNKLLHKQYPKITLYKDHGCFKFFSNEWVFSNISVPDRIYIRAFNKDNLHEWRLALDSAIRHLDSEYEQAQVSKIKSAW